MTHNLSTIMVAAFALCYVIFYLEKLNNPKIKKTKLYMLIPEGQVGRDAKMKLLDWFAGYLYKPVRLEKLDQLLIETNGSDSSIKLFEEINSIKENSENNKAFPEILD